MIPRLARAWTNLPLLGNYFQKWTVNIRNLWSKWFYYLPISFLKTLQICLLSNKSLNCNQPSWLSLGTQIVFVVLLMSNPNIVLQTSDIGVTIATPVGSFLLLSLLSPQTEHRFFSENWWNIFWTCWHWAASEVKRLLCRERSRDRRSVSMSMLTLSRRMTLDLATMARWSPLWQCGNGVWLWESQTLCHLSLSEFSVSLPTTQFTKSLPAANIAAVASYNSQTAIFAFFYQWI